MIPRTLWRDAAQAEMAMPLHQVLQGHLAQLREARESSNRESNMASALKQELDEARSRACAALLAVAAFRLKPNVTSVVS